MSMSTTVNCAKNHVAVVSIKVSLFEFQFKNYSELRLFRIHEMTCPKRFGASILESIKIHVSSPFFKVSHIWRGDQKSYRKMPKRVKRDRSEETSHNEPEEPPAKKKVKKRQSLITAFLQ